MAISQTRKKIFTPWESLSANRSAWNISKNNRKRGQGNKTNTRNNQSKSDSFGKFKRSNYGFITTSTDTPSICQDLKATLPNSDAKAIRHLTFNQSIGNLWAPKILQYVVRWPRWHMMTFKTDQHFHLWTNANPKENYSQLLSQTMLRGHKEILFNYSESQTKTLHWL